MLGTLAWFLGRLWRTTRAHLTRFPAAVTSMAVVPVAFALALALFWAPQGERLLQRAFDLLWALAAAELALWSALDGERPRFCAPALPAFPADLLRALARPDVALALYYATVLGLLLATGGFVAWAVLVVVPVGFVASPAVWLLCPTCFSDHHLCVGSDDAADECSGWAVDRFSDTVGLFLIGCVLLVLGARGSYALGRAQARVARRVARPFSRRRPAAGSESSTASAVAAAVTEPLIGSPDSMRGSLQAGGPLPVPYTKQYDVL